MDATDATTTDARLYTVWCAYGETLIVSGSEPVWLEPGVPADKLAEIDAPDYETACQAWRESQAADVGQVNCRQSP